MYVFILWKDGIEKTWNSLVKCLLIVRYSFSSSDRYANLKFPLCSVLYWVLPNNNATKYTLGAQTHKYRGRNHFTISIYGSLTHFKVSTNCEKRRKISHRWFILMQIFLANNFYGFEFLNGIKFSKKYPKTVSRLQKYFFLVFFCLVFLKIYVRDEKLINFLCMQVLHNFWSIIIQLHAIVYWWFIIYDLGIKCWV